MRKMFVLCSKDKIADLERYSFNFFSGKKRHKITLQLKKVYSIIVIKLNVA